MTVLNGVQYEGNVFGLRELGAAMSPIINGTDVVVVVNGNRRVFLNPNTVVPPFGASALGREVTFDVLQRYSKNRTEGSGTFVSVGPFDEYGHREFTIGQTNKGGTALLKTYIQGITKITPRYCVLHNLNGNDTISSPKQWTMHIATGTVPREVLRNVLLSRITNPDEPDEYFDIAYLFQQMGDFNQADEEFRLIEANPKFANLKERIRDARDKLGQLTARQILREIQRRQRCRAI